MEAVEAVLRWPHPVCGLVPPEQFRPLLESIEMQAATDRWTLHRACRDLAELTRRGHTRQRIAVKLSREFLSQESMLSHVEAAVSAADITPSRLAVDIDLRSLAGTGRTRDHLRQLRKRGASIFLDEFGTDGVPLARLSHLPIDGLKIARSFIARLEHDSGARAVCTSIIAIAHAFGLRCIATGIETRSQLEFLLEHGCDEAHGPLFSAPKSVADLAAGSTEPVS
jgi:EAL domain-containing protein (putative c-di-GMP-specific phosphodiesterase class I)